MRLLAMRIVPKMLILNCVDALLFLVICFVLKIANFSRERTIG
jgi:hypothetical protein